MLDLGAQYPDSEDLIEAFNREFAILRDSMSNIESLFKRILESRQFISANEVAEIFHCKPNELPIKLVRYKPSKVGGYVYKLSDVYKFIEERKYGG